MSTTLTEQLHDLKAASAGHLPPEIAETFAAQQRELAQLPAPTVAPGTAVPDAPLLTATGEATTLAALLDGAPAVLVFYRGAWCPYCNLALRAYQQELLPELERAGVRLVAVSPQTPDGSLSAAEKAELTFDVVTDAGNVLADALGIVDPGSDAVRAAQAGLGLDLGAVNAGGDVRLPMPGVVVLDAERAVTWAEVSPDYSARTEVGDILAAVGALAA